MSSSSPRGDEGLESELLARSACPHDDTALTAEKLLQTTGHMCFIWLYLLTHPVCVACEDSITQQHRGQKTETWTRRANFSLCTAVLRHQSVTSLHVDTQKRLGRVSTLKNVHFDPEPRWLTNGWFWSCADEKTRRCLGLHGATFGWKFEPHEQRDSTGVAMSVWTEISQRLSDGYQWHFVQTFMVPRWLIL